MDKEEILKKEIEQNLKKKYYNNFVLLVQDIKHYILERHRLIFEFKSKDKHFPIDIWMNFNRKIIELREEISRREQFLDSVIFKNTINENFNPVNDLLSKDPDYDWVLDILNKWKKN